ncbi:MAG: PEP-CTERM sorting domain-containing protein [Pirellula sp.]
MPHVIRSVAFLAIGILQLASVPSALRADIISDFKQQSGVSEDAGIRRAVYLGRLFNGVTGGPFRRMDSMYAIVTIAQATNVQLYAGDGNSNFDSALAQGKMVDTGIRITNRTQNNTEVIFVPGDPATTPPFKIDVPAGVAINDSLAANNRLDFWVVGDTNAGFTVPSTVAGNNANFFIRFDRSTAVPEPASIILVSAGLGVVVLRLRSRKKK